MPPTELEKQIEEVKFNDMRNHIRNELAKKHGWAEQERHHQELQQYDPLKNHGRNLIIAAIIGALIGVAYGTVLAMLSKAIA